MGEWSSIDQSENGKVNHLLTIRLNEHVYALPLDSILQIIPIRTMSTAPRGNAANGPVMGSMNLRGKAVRLIDLRKMLGLEGTNPLLYSPVIICRINGQMAGLVVDRVLTVVHLAAYAVTIFNATNPERLNSNGYIQGNTCTGDHPVVLLNLEYLLQDLPYEIPLAIPSAGIVMPGLKKDLSNIS